MQFIPSLKGGVFLHRTDKYPYVREPLVGSTEDDEIYLHWSYTDIEEKIEIQSISDHIDFTFINNKIILNVRMMDINELDPFLIYFVHFLARVL